VHNHVETEF